MKRILSKGNESLSVGMFEPVTAKKFRAGLFVMFQTELYLFRARA